MAAIEVMTLSKNPRVQHNAKRLISRLRLAKMRTAARFAAQMAASQKELQRKRKPWATWAATERVALRTPS